MRSGVSTTARRAAHRYAVLLAAFVMVPAVTAAQTREVSGALDEIVVTAQKREQNIQDVPIAMTALDAGALEKTFGRDLLDITGKAPNLIVDPILGNGTAAISIRGMQLNDVEKSFDPAVAVYLDGVYLATTTGALLQIWDAESVEVLRGPQGTLFGRNTIGGVVHVKRSDPTGELGGRVTGTFGSYDRVDVNAKLNLPAFLDDSLKLKATLMYEDGGGYFHNPVRDTDEGGSDYLGLTGTALWEPTESLSVSLTYDFIDQDSNTRPVTSLTQEGEVFNFGCNIKSELCGAPPQDADFHRNPTTTLNQEAFVHTDAVTLNGTWDINENHSMHGVFGWRETDENALQEFDGIGSSMEGFPLNGNFFNTSRPQNSDQFSIELRWHANLFEDRLQAITGLFYMDNDYSINETVRSPAFFGAPDDPGRTANSSKPQFRQAAENWAAFTQLDYQLTKSLSISAGVRFTEEQKKACGAQRLDLPGQGVTTLISYGSTKHALCNADDPFYSPTGVDPISGEIVERTGEKTWDAWTPRFALTYFLEQGMVFASYTEGFRSGGFNGRATTPFTLGPYNPEEVESFEIGAKTQWLNNRLQTNLVFFFMDYSNKQEDVVFPDPVNVTQTIVQNASNASIDGIEFELTTVPVDGLTLSGSLGYLDASFDDWTVPDPFFSTAENIVPIDQSDFELRRAPETTIGLNGVYEHALPNDSLLSFHVNYLWRDDYWITARTINSQPGQPGRNDSFGLLDASIAWDMDRWKISVFGKNLTDENYFLHTLDVGATTRATSPTDSTPVFQPGLWTFGTINAPRTFGVELDLRF